MREMVESELEESEAGRFRRGARKTSAEICFQRRLLFADEEVECPVLKELEMMTGEMLRRKAVRDRLTQCDTAQKAATSSLQSTLEYYERLRMKAIKGIELAAVAIVVVEAALKSQDSSVTDWSKNSRYPVAQYVQRMLEL